MPPGRSPRRPFPVAVIDIGSNSGRVVVLELDRAGHLRLLTGSRAPLRLVHDVDERRRLSLESMARTLDAVRDFHAIAAGAGARRIVAVATAAIRDARNGRALMDRIRRELGVRVDIIDGIAEARFGFAGAVRGLPVASGLLFDLGGGSMQISQFRQRRLGAAASLPLGALRLSEAFLESDPPRPREIRRLRDHVWKHLKRARVSRLRGREGLVGTGGTLRNLAKIDRSAHRYPITRVHGYVLSLDRLHEVVQHLSATRQKNRDEIAGLSADRADSIVGGAVAIETLMEFVRARGILVSGQGVREGIALDLLKMRVASPEVVKEASLASLVSRFDGWNAEAARRRRAVASALVRALEPRATAAIVEALDHGARLLDLGRSLDFFERHKHVADILLATELNGFTHEELAFVSDLVRRAGDRHADPEMLSPLVEPSDLAGLNRGAIILALADEIERRCPRGRPIAVSCKVGREVRVSVPLLPAWRANDLGHRFERAFGKQLLVRPGRASHV
ncbi:MAG TPA: Ppx/GppA phosphatase family protein [Vicinamibacterales bacterium]|nr:Ppx/GppA phosphatase family protein [Vicinamibacterales bacterium]